MTTHVAAAIIHRDGKVLAARRSDGELAGYWELPGGKVEEGESPVEALRREVQEELGCALGTAWLYDTVEHDYPDFHLQMDCFICTLPESAEPTTLEPVHDELRWLSREELLDVEWLPADTKLMQGLTYFWEQAFEDKML